MDPARNPFSPGAGSRPPELAGRDDVLTEARLALTRIASGRPHRSQLLLGLRGVGKTVLLRRIEEQAEELGYLTMFVEAPQKSALG